MEELRYRRLWVAVGVGLVLFVIYESLTPHPIDAGEVGGLSFGHLLAYLTMTLWFCQLFEGWVARLMIATAFILMGVGLEYAQGMTTYRTFDIADMRDNHGSSFRGPRSFFYEGHETLRATDAAGASSDFTTSVARPNPSISCTRLYVKLS